MPTCFDVFLPTVVSTVSGNPRDSKQRLFGLCFDMSKPVSKMSNVLCFSPCWHVIRYGWWPNLVDSWVGWVRWIFGRFWIFYGSFGGREGSHWIGSSLEIQMAWFSARFVEYGSSFDWFSWILWFSEKLGLLPDTVFIVFSARVLHNSHFPGFRSGPKRTATKSYADSWWYHLGECLLWLF